MNSEPQEILGILQEYENESRAIMDQIYQICWYMRGGVTREEAWQLSTTERKIIMKIIDENVERTQKTGMALL